jgi:hypothetical protein
MQAAAMQCNACNDAMTRQNGSRLAIDWAAYKVKLVTRVFPAGATRAAAGKIHNPLIMGTEKMTFRHQNRHRGLFINHRSGPKPPPRTTT